MDMALAEITTLAVAVAVWALFERRKWKRRAMERTGTVTRPDVKDFRPPWGNPPRG